ncbi:MAG: hypothetical protein WDN75_10655 [Bacteroidota bacterium]
MILLASPATNQGNLEQPLIFNIPTASPTRLVADHVYYVTVAPGSQAALTGIMDENSNVFGGINYSGTYYFKTATSTPPKLLGASTTPLAQSGDPTITFTSTNGAIINATFDQRGKAYYLVLNHLDAAPDKDQIKGNSAYTGFVARGNFDIAQTAPVSQFGEVTPVTPFVVGNTYDVWIYAENDALPTPFETAGPYGASPGFIVNGTGPTIVSDNVPSFGTGVTLNNPTITICNSSYQILNSPIIVTEGTNTQFYTGGGSQSFNIVLPAGFQFDVSLSGSTPVYGNLTLQGSDFTPLSGKLSFPW